MSTQSLFDLYANVSGGAGTPTLMFDYINTTGTDKLEVLFSTDGGATFGAALFTQAVAASWTSYTVPLTGATATSVVRFRATSDFGTTDIGLDNVNVSIVGCGQVTGLMAGSITATSASLSFTAPSGATDYTVTYTPQGGTAQTVSPNPMASPVALSGLMAGTLYTVGVITNCGGSSSTAATTTFTTAFACATPTYATLPYTQGFENTWLSNCALRDVPDLSWKNTPSTADADASFRRDDDGVSANWTSPTFGAFTPTGSTNNGATGTHSARFHSSYATAGTIGLFDLYVNATGGTGTPTVSFDYINTSGTDKLEVLVSTDGGVTFGAAQFTQVLSAAWTTYNVALTGATATTVVRLRATGDFGSTDIGLDNVNVSFVACPAVSNLMAGSITTTSAQLTFTAPSGASSYIVTYTGGGATTTVTPAPTASPVSLTGLMPSTAYSVSVRSDCGGGLTSTAVMTSFTTLTPPPSNDECAGAISLNSSSSTCTATTGSTIAATASTAAGTCAGTADDDVWFSFVASSVNQVIKVVGNSSFDAVVNLRSGTCPGTTVGSCADATAAGGTETITATGLTVGVTYYVRVYSYSSTAPTTAAAGGFTICVTAPADLVVSGTQTIPAGTYNNITIPSGAVGTLGGTVTVLGTFLVQADGQLNTACQTLNGSGAFTLDAGGKLGICSTSGLSSTAATGAVQMTGPRSFSTDGVYIFNGTAAQSTGNALPATVRSLTTTNAANVTLLQPVAVRQLVSVAAAGNIVTTTTNKLTLLSVIGGGTALVANTSTGAVTGAGGVMQRAVDVMNPENIGYHHYSSPVASTTMDDLAVPGIYTPVFNGAAYNSATTVGVVRPFPTVFGYNQARVGTTLATDQVIGGNAFNQGFEAPIDGTDPIVPGKGYTANVPNAANVDFVGTFNNAPTMATVFPGLSNLARNSHPNGGYHLLGNPFPSPINAATMAPTLTNMNDELHVFHSDSRYGGMYSSYIISTGVGTTSPSNGPSSTLIPAGAAFLMRVITPGAIGAVALTNANRITTFVGQPQPAFGRQTSTRALLQLQVSGAGRTDDLYFYTEAQATAGVDGQYDATKVTNPNGLNLATLTCSTQLAIDARPALTTATIVPMFIGMPAVGSYTLAVANLANFGTTAVYLRDALTGTRTLLAAGTAYRFTTTTTTAAGRFALEFAPVGTALATAAQSLDAQVQLYPNPTSNRFHVVLPAGAKASSATMSNALGQTVLTRSLTSNEADFDVHGLATGIYTLRLMVDGNAVTRKVVVE